MTHLPFQRQRRTVLPIQKTFQARTVVPLRSLNVGLWGKCLKHILLEVTVVLVGFSHLAVDLDMDDLTYESQSYISDEMNREVPPIPVRTNPPLSVPDKPTMAPPLPPEFDVSEGDSLSEQSIDQLIGLAPEKGKAEPKSIFKKMQSSVESGLMKVKGQTANAFSKMLRRSSDNNDLIGIGSEDMPEAPPFTVLDGSVCFAVSVFRAGKSSRTNPNRRIKIG